MRKPLARRKEARYKNISTQDAIPGIYHLDTKYGVIIRAFNSALNDRVAEVLATEVKKIMDIEPSTDDLDIRTYQN